MFPGKADIFHRYALTDWAWSQDLPADEKLLLLAIAGHAFTPDGEHEYCVPDDAVLQALTGFDEGRLDDVRGRLQERRLIWREHIPPEDRAMREFHWPEGKLTYRFGDAIAERVA